jgi:FkbM family methyltransferase
VWVVLGAVVLAGSAAWVRWGGEFTERFNSNRDCCQIPLTRNVMVSIREMAGLVRYPSEIGQDKWVLETMFPGVTDGYFVDVGSAHGTLASNSWALEKRGWTGVCIDPFPIYMEGRTCQMFKEVVFSDPPRKMAFQSAGGLGGISETIAGWNTTAKAAPTVEFTTVTLRDVLMRARAPRFVHFISIDIEGAELEALKAFPFETTTVGAWAIEHNREEPKRSDIKSLLETHGYRRVHSWKQDDFYTPASE